MKQDNLVTSVIGKFFQRSALGQSTYGTTLEEFQPNIKDKLIYLQEELLDGALYVEWCLKNLEELESIRAERDELQAFSEELIRIALNPCIDGRNPEN